MMESSFTYIVCIRQEENPPTRVAEHSANALEYDLPGLSMWKILQLEKWIDHQQDRNK